MKAFVLEKYAQPLREVRMPIPTPDPRQVLVRMIASGVNHADERTRAGQFKAVFPLALPKVMGGELSGEVVADRGGVTEFAVGQGQPPMREQNTRPMDIPATRTA